MSTTIRPVSRRLYNSSSSRRKANASSPSDTTPHVAIAGLLLMIASYLPTGECVVLSERPSNVTVQPGETVVLKCAIDKIDGQMVKVQWAKDGMLMGYDRSLPGLDRYTLVGSDTKRQFYLKIENVELRDDGVYDCQVMSGSGRLRAQAVLQVQGWHSQ